MAYLGWLFVGLLLGFGLAFVFRSKTFTAMNSFVDDDQDGSPQLVAPLLKSHFKPTTASEITITERRFPFRMRADLQRTIDKVFGGECSPLHAYWSDPNGMIYQYLDRLKASEPSDEHATVENAFPDS